LIERYRAPAAPFARKYTALDIEILVEMDKAHEDVCGPAITHLLKRAFSTYGDTRALDPALSLCTAIVRCRRANGLPEAV